MKRLIIAITLTLLAATSQAQDIPSIIKEGIKTVIRAIDLVIQRTQTKTIVLQEAQKTLENAMSSTLLDDIRDWVEQQKDLYGEYFQELADVKQVISDYHRVKEAIQQQEALVTAWQQSLRRFRADSHFSTAELAHIESVYAGILAESEQNLEQLLKATGILTFQMTDQQRLATIDQASDGIDRNFVDLQSFTRQNQLLSLQRARDENDYFIILKLYGL